METIPETKEIKTPSGEHTILVKSYLTGEDRRSARRTILDVHEQGIGTKVEGIEKVENETILRVVLKIDGDDQGIINRILSFRDTDYDFIVDTVNEITNGTDKKKLKSSDTNTETTSAAEKQD